jgi:two-component system LytT family response regulator
MERVTDRISAVVVDDEQAARDRLKRFLGERSEVEVVGEFTDVSEAGEALHTLKPDLIFMDIDMPGTNGLEFVKSLGEDAPRVIFVTAYDQYAVQAYEVYPADYLLKPFDRERFAKALDRALREIASDRAAGSVGGKVSDIREWSAERIAIKSENRIIFLRNSEIDWIEAAGNYLKFHTKSGEYLVRETMSAMENKLPSNRFMRIHRSTIVNLDRVKELKAGLSGDYSVTMQDGSTLTLSRGYRDQLDRLMK